MVCLYVYKYIHVYVYVNIRVYIFIYMCIYVGTRMMMAMSWEGHLMVSGSWLQLKPRKIIPSLLFSSLRVFHSSGPSGINISNTKHCSGSCMTQHDNLGHINLQQRVLVLRDTFPRQCPDA